MSKYKGRRTPYTRRGLGRKECARCGKKARYQWGCCANKSLCVPVCENCDILLNKMLLQFLRFSNWKLLLTEYTERVANNV